MRTTITPKQRILATLVKWTSLFLISLAIMTNTISGELPTARTNFSKTSSVSSGLKASIQTCPNASPDPTPVPVDGFCIYTPSTPGQCATASGYSFVQNECIADAIGTGSSSFCPTDEEAQFCQPGQVCYPDLTIPGCTVNNYCTAHSNDNTGACGGGNLTPTLAPPTQATEGCPTGFQPVGGECQINGGTSTQIITPPCSQGFVYISGTCYSNQPVDLLDVSSGICTLVSQGEEGESNGEESGAEIYWCPYTGTQLTCYLYITSNTEQCTYNGSAFYTCENLDANNDPGDCQYYGPSATGSTGPQVASSKCAALRCSITTCLNTLADPVTYTVTTLCDLNSEIQVNIVQRCSVQIGGVKLVCHYDSTNGASDKVDSIQISCQQPYPNLLCTATGPYNISLERQCFPGDPQQGDLDQCNITNGTSNTILWVDQCESITAVGTAPACTITSATGNVKLGTMACSSVSSCTITDDGGNTLTVTCSALTCYTGTTDPDCPHASEPSATVLTEAVIACDGSLVVDMLEYLSAGEGSTIYQIVYPLSQTELEFVLKELGIGSQTWSTANLPPENYL